jgi:DNA-binding MurR/RpiR family transcriptional regulator
MQRLWNVCSNFLVAATEACSDAAMTIAETPRDYAGLRALIVARAAQLPRRLAQIAAFAVENPDEMAFGTVAALAQSANVQPSALVRFSQALGYQGFSDLQEVFRSRLRERVFTYDERLEQLRAHTPNAAKSLAILHGFAQAGEKSITDLRNRIDPASLEEAVALLNRADTIYLTGLRRSFPIAAYISYTLGKLGVRHVLIGGVGGLAQEDVRFATAKDCLLAISFTPYASETIGLASAAKGRKVPILAITDSPFSPLVPFASSRIEVQEASFEGFRSMAATLALAMTLTVSLAERRGKPSPP